MTAIGHRVGSIQPLKHHVVKTCQLCGHQIYIMRQTLLIASRWSARKFICRECAGLEE